MKQRLLMFAVILVLISLFSCKANQDLNQTNTINLNSVQFKYEIEDVFKIKDKGIVVVGTVQQGTIKTGSTVIVATDQGEIKFTSTVDGIEIYQEGFVEQASENDPVALWLNPINVDLVAVGDLVIIK